VSAESSRAQAQATHVSIEPIPASGAVSITLGCSLAEIGRMHTWLDQMLSDASPLRSNILPDRARLAIRVCLEEAVANVVRHGKGDGRIEITLQAGHGVAIATIVDSGPEFDPTTACVAAPSRDLAQAQPGGRGIPLLRAYASAMAYERRGPANRLRLTFAL
jgi:serine/threonine-protein kinase RsbW